MGRQTVTFESSLSEVFAANPKRGSQYYATIQNNTDQSITVTVTNQDIQENPTPVYSPLPTPLTIASGDSDSLNSPYQAWTLTAGLAATGTVDITESG